MRGFKQKLKQVTVNKLDLPKDVLLDIPRLTMIGSHQLFIENHKGIVQFTEQFLHLRLNNNSLKIIGDKLVIRTIMPEEMLVEGIIKEVRYIE